MITAGVAGNTTADALRRLSRVLSRLQARPDLAIVQLEPNDVLRKVPLSSTLADLEAILIDFSRCGVPVLFTNRRAPAAVGTEDRPLRRHSGSSGQASW